MRLLLILCAALMLGLGACRETVSNGGGGDDDDGTTGPTGPAGCRASLTCDPLRDFPGVYRCSLNPPQPATFFVNATSVGDPQGIVVAAAGDTVTACPSSCAGTCLPPQVLR